MKDTMAKKVKSDSEDTDVRATFPLRLSEHEKDLLHRAAVLVGANLSTYIRMKMLEAARRDLGIQPGAEL